MGLDVGVDSDIFEPAFLYSAFDKGDDIQCQHLVLVFLAQLANQLVDIYGLESHSQHLCRGAVKLDHALWIENDMTPSCLFLLKSKTFTERYSGVDRLGGIRVQLVGLD